MNIPIENRISWLILLLTHHLLAGLFLRRPIQLFLECLDVHFGNVPCNCSDYMWELALHILNNIDCSEHARFCSVQLHLSDYQIPCYIDGLDIRSSLGIANALSHLRLWVWSSLLLHCHLTIFSVKWNKHLLNKVNSRCWLFTYVNWYFNSHMLLIIVSSETLETFYLYRFTAYRTIYIVFGMMSFIMSNGSRATVESGGTCSDWTTFYLWKTPMCDLATSTQCN